jgi:hypothetical protein
VKKLEAGDLKNLNLLKHYRIIRKWASKNNDLNEADLELLIYLDCIDLFTKKDFEAGSYSYSWDNRRWSGDREIEQLKSTTYTKFLLKVNSLLKEYIA